MFVLVTDIEHDSQKTSEEPRGFKWRVHLVQCSVSSGIDKWIPSDPDTHSYYLLLQVSQVFFLGISWAIDFCLFSSFHVPVEFPFERAFLLHLHPLSGSTIGHHVLPGCHVLLFALNPSLVFVFWWCLKFLIELNHGVIESFRWKHLKYHWIQPST